MPKIVPVVLCGGSGTRLWPRSRAEKPKPFLPLLGDRTLFQSTLDRCSDRNVFAAPVIVIGEKHLEHARTQAGDANEDPLFIVEPMGKNTAPAIALAALALDPEDVMLVCPSDHHIVDRSAFMTAACSAAALAREDWLVSFGIAATSPETGYGYIRRGEAVGDGFRVHSFVEKPDIDRAIAFLADGEYAWNGGIFAFKAKTFLAELKAHRPETYSRVVEAFETGQREGMIIRPDTDSFGRVEKESVDYAVMENTKRAAMVDVTMGWSDIGNWDALFEQRRSETQDNVIVGPGEVIGAVGSMIDSDGPHVTIVGTDNIVVVVDGDDILVASREAVQRVGEARRCSSL